MEKKELTLNEAAEAVSQLTPEDYIEIQRYINASENPLPEAASSINFRAKSKNLGFEFQITLRDNDENRLLERVLAFGEKLNTEAQIAPVQHKAKAEPVQATGEIRITSNVEASVIDVPNVIMYEVSTLVHKINKNGGSYYKVKGGPWTQWGWNAFSDVFPKDVALPTVAKDAEITQIPSDIRYAYVDKDQKRVVAFASSV